MTTKYKATDIHSTYFITLTTVGSIDEGTDCSAIGLSLAIFCL